MDRIKKAMDRIKRYPVTLDSCFRRFFEMGTPGLRDFKGKLDEVMAARLTMHLRDDRDCINRDIEQEGFEKLAAVIKSCPENVKPKRKGSGNANTSRGRRRQNA